MGGKSKPTIGYWYSMLIHFGLGRGPLDAILEFRGGDKTAWAGEQTDNGVIEVDAADLWGGEKAEGGIKGQLHVMMGAQDQMPSALLADVLGPDQSAYRGRATVIYNGRYGAFNPYPKPAAFKVRRILKGWDNDDCWYEGKAAIPLVENDSLVEVFRENFASGLDSYSITGGDGASFTITSSPYGNALKLKHAGASANRIERPISFAASRINFKFFVVQRPPVNTQDSCVIEMNATASGIGFNPTRASTLHRISAAFFGITGQMGDGPIPEGRWYTYDCTYDQATGITTHQVVDIADNSVFATHSVGPGGGVGPMTFSKLMFRDDDSSDSEWLLADVRFYGIYTSQMLGFNPAHMLYDSLTSQDMQGESPELINETSFMAAADQLYAEGFGLCTEYDAGSETVEQFQQRICNVIGASLSQSRTNGQYYLTLVRGDYVLADLPILGDDDILEYAEEPTDPLESVNQVSVEWFDPARKEKRTTTPIQALGAIQASGGVMAETVSYPEIPLESLALRVGARDLRQKSLPLKRFTLTTTRVAYSWRAGQIFRLQAPRRGIADMVCVLGEVGAGVRRSGAMSVKAIQDVSGFPSTTYVEAEPGVDTSPSPVPAIPEVQAAFEASYVDLVASMTTAELAALAPDAGFLLAAAARPSSGLNFDLWSRAAGEEFADGGSGDWCPGAVVVEGSGWLDTEFTLEQATDLSDVAVGQAALWGSEICRVESIDVDALEITLARGCVDTVPQIHAPGEPILFYDGGAASDTREYSDGEDVEAKVRTRTSSQLLELDLAPTLVASMASRAARPYAPGLLRISDDLAEDQAYPVALQGELEVSWAHRDRVLQADQLVSEGEASIGPEAGTTYTVTFYLDDAIEHTESGITGTSATPHSMASLGLGRIEVEAVRDGLVSWQAATAEFTYDPDPPDYRITDSGDARITDSGDDRILE